MRVYAITGYKRHGKDTVADFICDNYTGTDRIALADPIKSVARYIFGWNDHYTDGDLKEDLAANGIVPREFLQWFGTEIMQYALNARFPLYKKLYGRTIWVQYLIRKLAAPIWELNNTKAVVISDLRFPHEVKELERQVESLVVIKVIRKKVSWFRKLFWHESEKAVDKITPNHVIYNTGTVEDLHEQVKNIMKEYEEYNGRQN
jgi:hypothetical protein